MRHLNYFISNSETQEQLGFHLDPDNADVTANASILNSLIGTLVKTGTSGKAEPYLASSYFIEDGGKTWTYTLRDNLQCEDGTPISAENFVRRLKFMLKLYSRKSVPMDFDNLVGWKQFHQTGEGLTGLAAAENRIIFRFEHAPEAFNEILRMEYFGYWCEGNFDANGEWKKGSRPISSGAYALIPGDDPNVVRIRKRPDWFSVTEASPDEVSFRYASPKEISEWRSQNPDLPFFIQSRGSPGWKDMKNVGIVRGIPDSLQVVVINPRFSTGLDHQGTRQALQDSIRAELRKSDELESEFFYATGRSDVRRNPILEDGRRPLQGKTLKFAIRGSSVPPHERRLVNATQHAVERLGANLEILYLDPQHPKTLEIFLDHQSADFRLTNVGIGGHFLNVAIKMMFCSKMGASFPDPSGRICELVHKQDQIGGPIGASYIEAFNQILEDDASVLPIRHHGTVWLMSDSIDPAGVSPVAIYPNIEDIVLK